MPSSDLSWIDAIARVLGDARSAMHYTDIADAIVTRGLRKAVGATPAATVAATISTNISKSPHPLFVKVGKGEYVLRATVDAPPAVDVTATAAGATPAAGAKPQTAIGPAADGDDEPTAIQAIGMFWRRDRVEWTSTAKLLGAQQQATPVDFHDQRGVYLLHDGRATVYAGRVVDRALGKRLWEHTTDRLNGRWDRFSWFGVRRVTPAGKLENQSELALSPTQIIVELEAVLIESLEPPLNRKRGDGLRAGEYIQVDDPVLQQKQLAGFFQQLQAKMLGG